MKCLDKHLGNRYKYEVAMLIIKEIQEDYYE